MSELNKDSAIKLFGKTIPLSAVNDHYQHCHHRQILPNDKSSNSPAHLDDSSDPNLSTPSRQDTSNMEVQEHDKENSEKEVTDDKQEEDDSSQQIKMDLKDPTTSSGISDNPKSPSIDKETSSPKSSNNGEQSETSTPQGKTLKKPDKILPCPRCNSMDTKFCYYNNYNVNQPRHFCKNCQRYWTAGGTMRNVPVGAGRRKNKSSSASNYRQIMISEAFRAVQANVANEVHSHNPSFGNNGTVLNFGSDSPLCESVASVLSLSDKRQYCVRNGFNNRPEQRILASHGGRDNGDDRSSGSSITATNSSDKGRNCSSQEAKIKNYQGFSPPVTYFPGPPWSYPWNSPMPPSTALYPSGFPVSFYPETTYWGCAVPSHWNMPCLSPSSSSIRQRAPNSSPNSPNLGKHSRDGNIINPGDSEKEPSGGSNNSERSVLVPKTLRIDDPSEAAKSSIWAALGIKSEKTSSGEALFKGFNSKGDEKNYSAETSAVLQANPAALSRSLNFHEST